MPPAPPTQAGQGRATMSVTNPSTLPSSSSSHLAAAGGPTELRLSPHTSFPMSRDSSSSASASADLQIVPSTAGNSTSTSDTGSAGYAIPQVGVTEVLLSITQLLVSYGETIQAQARRIESFETCLNGRLEALESKISQARRTAGQLDVKRNDRGERVWGMVGKVDRLTQSPARQSSKRVPSSTRKGKGKAPGYSPRTMPPPRAPKSWTTVLELTPFSDDDRTPSSPRGLSLLQPEDRLVIRQTEGQDDPGFSPPQFQTAEMQAGPAAPRTEDLSLVGRAIEDERARLAGHNVLGEGEATVGFTFRQRHGKRKRDESAINMDFLEGISADSDVYAEDPFEAYRAPSQLSSGIEDLPESSMSPPPDIPLPARTYMSRGREVSWQPFPLALLRQGSVTPAPTSSGWTEDTHLTAVRRGTSLVEEDVLPPGRMSAASIRRARTGKRKRTVKWPRFGSNTIKSRMQEIMCDICKGRVHWACAGLSHGKDMSREPWSCPNCMHLLERADRDEVKVAKAQQDRCLREDCIYASGCKLVRKNDDVAEFLMERIVGRRRLRWDLVGKPVYQYLVKWYDWEIYDSTWEPASHIPNLAREEALFTQQIKRAALDDPREKVVLLPDAQGYFDHKGNYEIELLERMGVERRWWWED